MRIQLLALCILMGAFALLVPACKKSSGDTATPQSPPVSSDSLLQCHRAGAPDSAAVQATLTGQWSWRFIRCYWKTEEANGDDFAGLKVLFRNDQTLQVIVNGAVQQTSNWRLQRESEGYFRLITDPLVGQLTGRVVLCNGWLFSYDSYTDGCDNWFRKE